MEDKLEKKYDVVDMMNFANFVFWRSEGQLATGSSEKDIENVLKDIDEMNTEKFKYYIEKK